MSIVNEGYCGNGIKTIVTTDGDRYQAQIVVPESGLLSDIQIDEAAINVGIVKRVSTRDMGIALTTHSVCYVTDRYIRRSKMDRVLKAAVAFVEARGAA